MSAPSTQISWAQECYNIFFCFMFFLSNNVKMPDFANSFRFNLQFSQVYRISKLMVRLKERDQGGGVEWGGVGGRDFD